jgi:hypothetical protein
VNISLAPLPVNWVWEEYFRLGVAHRKFHEVDHSFVNAGGQSVRRVGSSLFPTNFAGNR